MFSVAVPQKKPRAQRNASAGQERACSRFGARQAIIHDRRLVVPQRTKRPPSRRDGRFAVLGCLLQKTTQWPFIQYPMPWERGEWPSSYWGERGVPAPALGGLARASTRVTTKLSEGWQRLIRTCPTEAPDEL